MTRRTWIAVALGAVIALQGGVLAAEYLNAVYPLWTGREVRLKTVPVDPRSLFRGNYARLRYEISQVDAKDLEAPGELRAGEIIYVRLRETGGGVYGYDGASLTQPGEGLFLRGRIEGHRRGAGGGYAVRYGIEAWFAPKDMALDLERKLRAGGIAVVMVASSGKPALKEIVAEGE